MIPYPDDSVGLDNKKSIENALKHPDVLGAGAKKREHLKPKEKITAAVKEYEKGTLNSGSGHRAKSKAQAIAIGYAEAKKKNDIRPTDKYKGTLQSYGLSSLKNNNGATTSPVQARQIAAQKSGQSWNDHIQKFRNSDRFGIRKK